MIRHAATAAIALICAAAHGDSLIQNGGFEATSAPAGAVSGDGGYGAWTLGESGLVPANWTLNPAYPGEVSVADGALRVHGNGQRGLAHVYQPCPTIETGRCYVITASVRGGPVSFLMYEYFADRPMKVPTIIAAPASADEWREVTGYYWPEGDGFASASLAIVTPEGATVDIDDVAIEDTGVARLPDDAEPVIIENDLVRLRLSATSQLEEFTCKATGVNYARPDAGPPVFRAGMSGGEMPARSIKRTGDDIEISFPDPSARVVLSIDAKPRYIALTVKEVEGEAVDWVQLCDLRLDITENVGTLVNAAWTDDFTACVLACNDQVHSYGADGSRAALMARCYREYGLEGARVAIVGTPEAPLDAIEAVELAEGLPHPEIDGVWIKRAPQRFSSYLMAGGVGEHNIDEIIEFARDGFGCIELLNWWESTPTYAVHPGLYPSGIDGLKECADKVHAAGMELGLHAMQGMVGWGGIGLKDPYVTPSADPRLLRDRAVTLGQDATSTATELATSGDLTAWPERGDLYINGEVVRYATLTENGFGDCTRGMHETATRDHPVGSEVSLLVNCFNMWDHLIYAPDVNSTLVDEICDSLAGVFNAVGADMAYFDGGEEIAVQPPQWANQGRIALGVMERLDRPVILEGNALYTHLSWHVISRGSPSYDPIYYGRREYTLRSKGQNPARWGKNLLTGDVGWFRAHTHSPSTHAVTPDEVMLLCLKALGGKAPISFQVDSGNLYANKRMPEMLEIIRACDELKRRDYFSDEVCRAISEPMAEHVLEQADAGEWQVRPLTFGPPQVVTPGPLTWQNPHAAQPPWIQIRARTKLAEHGSADNIVLADFTDGARFTPDAAASGGLGHSIDASTEQTPGGAAAIRCSVNNQMAERSGWTRATLPIDPVIDLSSHRRLGVWVRADGSGGILNVQLVQSHGFRDHYIDLDYEGWRYHELTTGESSRFYGPTTSPT